MFQPSKEYLLYEWLRSKGLEHYVISFMESGIVDLEEVARLRLPDEELYDELEITLPGHKRRLERAGEFSDCSEIYILITYRGVYFRSLTEIAE